MKVRYKLILTIRTTEGRRTSMRTLQKTDSNNSDNREYAFKRVGGWLCLDFTNTVSWRGNPNPKEHLRSYIDLVKWSVNTQILTATEAEKLLRKAAQQPKEAMEVLERAINLREALYRIFLAASTEKNPNSEDLSRFNRELANALAHMQLQKTRHGYQPVYARAENALDQILWHIADSAAKLLTSEKLEHVRRCGSEECGWLFLDMSRNHSRRWCAMEDCGNRAKARRHYQQTKLSKREKLAETQ